MHRRLLNIYPEFPKRKRRERMVEGKIWNNNECQISIWKEDSENELSPNIRHRNIQKTKTRNPHFNHEAAVNNKEILLKQAQRNDRLSIME